VRRPRVYVDSSVLGGAKDKEFADATERFLAKVRRGDYLVLVSTVTVDEISKAPPEVRAVLIGLPQDHVLMCPLEEEAMALAEAYVDAGVVGPASKADAEHVAAATVLRADLILSWNFRHIVNYSRIQQFSAVNLLNGYRTPDIRSPLELAYGDEDEDVRLRGDEEPDSG